MSALLDMGTERGSLYTDITRSQRQQTAVLYLVLTAVIIVGSLWIIARTVLEYLEVLREGKKYEGARRLRRILVICLTLSDMVVALSNVYPTALSFTGKVMGMGSCNPAGLVLAMGIWWQYGFSITIACTTFTSLRFPTSRFQRFAESWFAGIIVVIILLGIVQAIIWRFTHGYVAWDNFCYYGAPNDQATHLMQFLPRFLTSLTVTFIYIPLIAFLRRPELTATMIAPPSNLDGLPSVNGRKIRASRSNDADLPPWERLAISGLDTFAFGDPIDKPAPTHQDSGRRDVSTGQEKPATPLQPAQMPIEDYDTCPKTVRPTDTPITPQRTGQNASFEKPAIQVTSPALTIPSVTFGRPTVGSPDRSDGGRPSTASSWTAYSPELAGTDGEKRPASIQTAGTLGSDGLTRKEGEGLDEDEGGSLDFAGMLSDGRAEGDTSTPKGRPTFSVIAALLSFQWIHRLIDAVLNKKNGERGTESMASYMKRSTSRYLVWFPVTHFIICCFSIGRFAAYSGGSHASFALEIITIWTVFAQSIVDMIVFGWLEPRTQRAYKKELDEAYAPKAESSQEQLRSTLEGRACPAWSVNVV